MLNNLKKETLNSLERPTFGETASYDRISKLVIKNIKRLWLSYLISAFVLYGLAWQGETTRNVAIAYLVCGGASCAILLLIFKHFQSVTRRDPILSAIQTSFGGLIQCGFLYAAPKVGVIFLLNILTIYVLGALALSNRQYTCFFVTGVIATGLIIFLEGERLCLPSSTAISRLLFWISFVLAVGRCVFVGVFVSGLRSHLDQQNQGLIDALEKNTILANEDPLTGTANRRAITKLLHEESERSVRTGMPVSIAMLDLDHFKRVNDCYGHDVGDLVLQRFAHLVNAAKRENDRLGRYGGEEFILILPSTQGELAYKALERIRMAIESDNWQAIKPELKITVSIGIATFRPGEVIENAIRAADTALYQAKHAGRNRVLM